MNILRRAGSKLKFILINYKKSGIIPDKRIKNFITIIDNGYGNKNSYLRQKPVNAIGEPIPWFTYPSIEYLSQLDLSAKSILEWGIGNSTLFFAKRCKKITSIEHNSEWYNLVTQQLPDNSRAYLIAEAEYSNHPKQLNENFDIIIVDGIKRLECLQTALTLINPGGMIIFDNSDRNPEYCKFIREQNLIQIDFHGFGPIVNFTSTTSVFFTRDANFIPLTVQPIIPIGGGY